MGTWVENIMRRFTAQEAPAKPVKYLRGWTKLEAAKAEFIHIMGTVERPGVGDLLAWLEIEGFFTAPASSKHHLAVEGGLLIHSLNVYRNLRDIADRDILQGFPALHPREVEESMAIMGLLHDVCKVGVYHQETKTRTNRDTGEREEYQGYFYRDPLPLGHGEKSVFQIMRFIQLTEEEALAIRWHMGAYDAAGRGGSRDLNNAMNSSPWVYRLHEADMRATHVNEREV